MVPAPYFHRFPDLPYDIRRQIYVLATPPRVVYIREGFPDKIEPWDSKYWDLSEKGLAFEAFERQLESGHLRFNLNLHPDLAYFARNWRDELPWYTLNHRQTQLEEYGFTSNKTAYEPWAPTPETPRIPTDWLADHPDVAFELARQSWLYSKAPTPAFLHVCKESREALKRWGYQLAFGTRSHAPRTWFHFERDILYVPFATFDLPYSANDYKTLLSGCWWDIGQFDLASLHSVKRLLLADTRPPYEIADQLASVIILFPNLAELLLEDWQAEDLLDWFVGVDRDRRSGRERDETYETWEVLDREPRVCIAWDPIDTVGSICWFDYGPRNNWGLGPQRSDLHGAVEMEFTPYPKIIGHSTKGDRQRVAQDFAGELERTMNTRAPDHSSFPSIRHVHTIPESLCQQFLRGRYQFWQDFSRLQDNLRRGSGLELPDSAVLEPRFRVNLEEVDKESKMWLRRYHHFNDLMDEAWAWERNSQDKHWLVRWYFDGPSIPEPSLHVV